MKVVVVDGGCGVTGLQHLSSLGGATVTSSSSIGLGPFDHSR